MRYNSLYIGGTCSKGARLVCNQTVVGSIPTVSSIQAIKNDCGCDCDPCIDGIHCDDCERDGDYDE